MRLPALFQFRVLKLALTSLFSKAYTDPFPKGDYAPIPQYRGRPRYQGDGCIGCGACAEVCPSDAIDLVDDLSDRARPVRRLTHHLDVCLQCGQCQKYCTTEKGIRLTNEWDYVGFSRGDFEEKIQKDLLLCEVCGKVIAPVDQIRWLANRLGALSYGNPTLLLASHRDMAVVDKGFDGNSEYPVRGRRVNIQCPHCRRKTALTA
ncbi:MAG: 4Fe-4S dicluster domain-containing protein [Planctomycetota bacterium]